MGSLDALAIHGRRNLWPAAFALPYFHRRLPQCGAHRLQRRPRVAPSVLVRAFLVARSPRIGRQRRLSREALEIFNGHTALCGVAVSFSAKIPQKDLVGPLRVASFPAPPQTGRRTAEIEVRQATKKLKKFKNDVDGRKEVDKVLVPQVKRESLKSDWFFQLLGLQIELDHESILSR